MRLLFGWAQPPEPDFWTFGAPRARAHIVEARANARVHIVEARANARDHIVETRPSARRRVRPHCEKLFVKPLSEASE